MSHLDNFNDLEKQLADLQLMKGHEANMKPKKIPPAVPPKKKALPQVPQSATVCTLSEPSYSSRIYQSMDNGGARNADYLDRENFRSVHRDNANMSHPSMTTSYNTAHNNIGNAYANTPYYGSQVEQFSPPPPPPPNNYTQIRYEPNQNCDVYLPPPSPVSSNYSELARASSNHYNTERSNCPIYQNDYPSYGASQNSHMYESLYEPINPAPSSVSPNEANSGIKEKPNKSPLPKEEEVDALTDLLVKSISASQEVDVFGICVKCKDKVIGENSGCTAMGNMYHKECFCCYYCNINLQGKPFYAVDGHPYCEEDYYETLEKCSVCNKPILNRILRATGKPYHPACFICVVCGKSLDGIPFTVDALNQIHCIEDFHRKFAPRCCVCELPIMPEDGEEEAVRVVALDRSFHVKCYRCEDCGLLLTSESEGRGCYPLDNHILCKQCNGHRVNLLTNVMTTDL